MKIFGKKTVQILLFWLSCSVEFRTRFKSNFMFSIAPKKKHDSKKTTEKHNCKLFQISIN